MIARESGDDRKFQNFFNMIGIINNIRHKQHILKVHKHYSESTHRPSPIPSNPIPNSARDVGEHRYSGFSLP